MLEMKLDDVVVKVKDQKEYDFLEYLYKTLGDDFELVEGICYSLVYVESDIPCMETWILLSEYLVEGKEYEGGWGVEIDTVYKVPNPEFTAKYPDKSFTLCLDSLEYSE